MTHDEMKDALPWKYYLHKVKREVHGIAPYVNNRWFLRVYKYDGARFKLVKESTLDSREAEAFERVFRHSQFWAPLPPNVAERELANTPAAMSGR